MQVSITETIAALNEEFANETPAAFHVTPPSPLRIFAPAHTSFGAGEVNGNYFDSYISSVGSYYANHPLSVVLFGGAREFVGNTQSTQFVFTEVNLNNGAIRGHLHRLAADHAKRPVLQWPACHR